MPEVKAIAYELLSAADYELDWECSHTLRPAVAAAIQVAVNRVISSVSPPVEDSDEYAKGFLAAHLKCRAEFLAIIEELQTYGEIIKPRPTS